MMQQPFDVNRTLTTAHSVTQETGDAHLRITRDWVILFGAIGAVSIVLVTLLGFAATWARLWRGDRR